MSAPGLPTGRCAALIPAAGSGTRLGRGPKAFVEVAGQSLLARSVRALAPHVDEVVVALPPGTALPPGVPARAIVGGDTRQESVRRLLQATAAEWVLIHDAARPFLPQQVIHALLDALADTGAVTAALPVADTLVRAGTGVAGLDSGLWGDLVAREDLWAVQTPQGFARALLLSAHDRARSEGYAGTDDAGLVARQGGRVRLVPGDARLFKVTAPGDLALAGALAAAWDRGER